jgi:hypothetical protein
MTFESIKKELSVAILLVMLLAMDYLKIVDPELKYLIMGLAGTITGFGGFQASPLNPANKTASGGPAAPQ